MTIFMEKSKEHGKYGKYVGSPTRQGMNRDVHVSRLGEMEYGVTLNANVGSETGDAGMVQHEPSNVLCWSLDGWLGDMDTSVTV
jgi:hypothetical protein